MTTSRFRATWLQALAFVSLIGSVACVERPPVSDSQAGDYPSDLTEWVTSSDEIVLATIVETHFLGFSSGYDESGSLVIDTTDPRTAFGLTSPITGTPAAAPPMILLPVSNIAVRVNHVYVTSSGVQVDDILTVSMLGPTDYPAANCAVDTPAFPSGQMDEQFLYALRLQPDGVAYGMAYGEASRLNVATNPITATSCPPTDILFTSNREPGAFLAELEDIIDSL